MTKVLLVEDDLRLKLTYDIILKKEGYTVERAVDGEDALGKAETFGPDLILLDLLMPKMTGLDFLEQYDLKNKHPNVKVIVFSNMSVPDDMERAYALGATHYLLKSSTSPKQLAQLVKDTLSTPAPATSTDTSTNNE